MVAFQEVFRRSGIDERRSPPGMVVPLGGDNIVALIDPGRKLKFEPAHALDAPLIGAYHRAMDERVRFGQRAGESKTGRKLIHAIAEAGGRVAAAGSSDHARAPAVDPSQPA